MRLKSAALRGHRKRTDSCWSSRLCLARIRSKLWLVNGGKVPESKREVEREQPDREHKVIFLPELSPAEKDKSCRKCTGWEGKGLLLVTDLPGHGRSFC